MKFFPQAQMQSPTDMCTHALFILSKEKGESKGKIFFIAKVSTGKNNEKGGGVSPSGVPSFDSV